MRFNKNLKAWAGYPGSVSLFQTQRALMARKPKTFVSIPKTVTASPKYPQTIIWLVCGGKDNPGSFQIGWSWLSVARDQLILYSVWAIKLTKKMWAMANETVFVIINSITSCLRTVLNEHSYRRSWHDRLLFTNK